ncbi:hypothetical protein AB0P21_27815 [Kribbella sp. NPDC056861]|uniref:hypothetical protein n=1 Tax=Kribbella sp. NPDC056861 TaxID=3154857 RepID=UPI00341EBC7F
MTTPYPTDNDRDRTADLDAPDRTADADANPLDRAAGTDALDRPADTQYNVDQVNADQAPLDTVTEPVTYPADTEPVDATPGDSTPADATAVDSTPVDAAPPTTHAPTTPAPATDEPLVPTSEAVDFKARWDVVQQGFVDDPRSAVTDADKLVSDVLERLSATFDQQHRDLEGQWSDGEPSTEDLRSALQKYRAFFQRLLTI